MYLTQTAGKGEQNLRLWKFGRLTFLAIVLPSRAVASACALAVHRPTVAHGDTSDLLKFAFALCLPYAKAAGLFLKGKGAVSLSQGPQSACSTDWDSCFGLNESITNGI